MSNRLPVLARYNAWANHKLYAAVEPLTVEQFWEDRGVFFKSLCGTLNHLLAADRIWMGRFTGKPEAGLQLESLLFEDFDALHAARQAEDTATVHVPLFGCGGVIHQANFAGVSAAVEGLVRDGSQGTA